MRKINYVEKLKNFILIIYDFIRFQNKICVKKKNNL